MYDIACAFKSHLYNPKSPLYNQKEKFDFAVSIFHSYAHTPKCQVNFSPRRIENMGLSDGENLERLWSYLGKFACIIRHMYANHRMDFISLAIEHVFDNSIENLG